MQYARLAPQPREESLEQIRSPVPRAIERCGNLAHRQQGGPPALTQTVVAEGKEAARGHRQQHQKGADPAQAHLNGLAVQDARLAYVRGKGRPAAIVIGHLA